MEDDDVARRIERLERRLDELQAELDGAAAPRRERARSQPPPPARPLDPLEQFGVELRRLAGELVAAYDRTVEHERGRARRRRRLVLESEADLHDLAALERALAAGPGVVNVALRAYAAGHASLLVELDPGPG